MASYNLDRARVEDGIICSFFLSGYFGGHTFEGTWSPSYNRSYTNTMDWMEHLTTQSSREPVSHWPLLGKAGLPWPTPIFKCVIGIVSDLGHQSLNLILTHPMMTPISECCILWLVLWHLSEALLGLQELVLGELHPSRAIDFLWHYRETWLLLRQSSQAVPFS